MKNAIFWYVEIISSCRTDISSRIRYRLLVNFNVVPSSNILVTEPRDVTSQKIVFFHEYD
jgi:hypothetical protein